MLFINLHFKIYKGDFNVKNFCAVSMVVAIAMGMSACQDRNSTDDDGTHGSNDPATKQQMDKNS